MYLFQSIGSYFYGASESFAKVLVTGSFYIEERGKYSCLYNDCTAIVCKTNKPFVYELRIDQKDDDDVNGIELYELSAKMRIRQEEGPCGGAAFCWLNPADTSKTVLLELDDTNSALLVDGFLLSVCSALYEHRNKTSAADARMSEKLSLCGSPQEASQSAPPSTSRPSTSASTRTPTSPSSGTTTSPYTSPNSRTASSTYGASSTYSAPPSTRVTTSSYAPSSSYTSPSSYTPPSSRTPPSSYASLDSYTSPSSYASAYTQSSERTPPRGSTYAPASSSRLESKSRLTPVFARYASLAGSEEMRVSSAELSFFDQNANSFAYLQKVSVIISLVDRHSYLYKLYLTSGSEVLVAVDISDEMLPSFSPSLAFVFVQQLGQGKSQSFRVEFLERDYATFENTWINVIMAARTKADPKLQEDESDFLRGTFQEEVHGSGFYREHVDVLRFEKLSLGSNSNNDDGDDDEVEVVEDGDEEYVDDDDGDDVPAYAPSRPGAKNSSMALGARTDRAFVVRGTAIGVFKTEHDKMRYLNSITSVKTKDKKAFSPKKIQLHESDSQMLMIHPDSNKKLLAMDLNRPDVVQEWDTGDIPVTEMMPQTKYAQTTPTKTVVGMNSLGFYLIDPRLYGSKAVESHSYFYPASSRPQVACGATTGSGALAVGTRAGEIRLFDSNTFAGGSAAYEDHKPRAKTSLPGLGDAILGIDVTDDGRWVLATCKTYLLVISVSMDDGRNTGFEKPMGKSKNVPRRLQPRVEDIIKMGGAISFTPAKFNSCNPNKLVPELSIVTSSANWVFSWDFNQVKKDILDGYIMKAYDDVIVSNQFKFGDARQVVVTTPNDVRKENIVKTGSEVKSPNAKRR